MKKAILIYNPLSGDRSVPLKLDYIIERFQSNNILLQPYRIGSQDNLVNAFQENKYELVIISGGDGTLNSIINLLLTNNINLPIGIIPSGTCNDFGKCLNLPRSLDECLDVIISGTLVSVDVGLINEEKYFLSTCAGGLFVDVSFSTHKELKKNLGPFAYYLKALSEVRNINDFMLRVQTEEETIEEKVLLFLILNGKQAGGFNILSNEADLSDGLMDIVLIKNCTHIDLASILFKVLTLEALNDKNIRIVKAKNCIIEGNNNVTLSVDGEKGPKLPIKVRFINKALQVYVFKK